MAAADELRVPSPSGDVVADGLAGGTRATVSELVAYDPRKADCRLRIRVASDDAVARSDRGTLSLRGRSSRR